MNRTRKRKRISTDHGSKNEPTPKRIKTEVSRRSKRKHSQVAKKNSSALIASVREIRIILDKSIVERYFHAKQILREILSSPKPIVFQARIDRKKSKRRNKQTSLLDYLHMKNDAYNDSSSKSIERSSGRQNASIKKEEPSFVAAADDHNNNNTPTLDVNMPVVAHQPQINSNFVYYMTNDQSNCFLLDNNMMIVPADAQFCNFVPVMGVPVKTEFFCDDVTVKEEPYEMNSSFTIYDHTIADSVSIEDIDAGFSTPLSKPAFFDEQTIVKPCSSDDEVKYTPVKFDKRGCPICPKCERSFKMLEAFKQHKLLCGLKFLYDCLYCAYNTKFSQDIRKHIDRRHKMEIEGKDFEKILQEIKQNRMNKKNLSLMSKKESEIDSGVEESFVKIRESKITPSKLAFDLHCRGCEKSFKRINGITMKKCPDCELTLEFKCQTCSCIFSSYSKAYKHVKKSRLENKCLIRRRSVSTIKYNCDHCNFETWYKGVIREHIFHWHIKNNRSTFFKCELCTYESLYENNFKRHKRNVHGVNETFDLDA